VSCAVPVLVSALWQRLPPPPILAVAVPAPSIARTWLSALVQAIHHVEGGSLLLSSEANEFSFRHFVSLILMSAAWAECERATYVPSF
jgi:hypothetical protein